MTIASLPMDDLAKDNLDSPRGPLITGLIALALMILVFVLWASTMSVSGGAIASGKVGVEGNRKAIQHREGGTIQAILVREGQRVEKGQPLIELRSTEVQAEITVLESVRVSTMARLARLRAEARDEAQIVWPPEIAAMRSDLQVRGVLEQETAVFEARLAAYKNSINLLRQQIEGRYRQIEGLQGRLAATQAQVVSYDQERESLLPLVERGLVPRPRVLTLDRMSAALTADIETIRSQMEGERTSIGQAETQIAQLERDRREAVAREITEMEARLAEVLPRLASLRERLHQAVLTAPEAGYVHNLIVSNPGAVIAPGQVALEIVPAINSMVLNVEVDPRDVERVRPGQEVIVHLLAYAQRYQSIIKGRLEKVSPDRFDDPMRQTSFYRAVVRIDEAELKRANVELLPGMPVQVIIETGSRTIVHYFLDPIFHVQDFAFRER